MVDLDTARLRLRPWVASDLAPFASMNTDPEVMAHFPEHLGRAASDGMARRIAEHIEQHGWGLWAVESKQPREFIGVTGLAVPRFEAPFMPAVEVGWRLARSAWGKGYATEAAHESLRFAFEDLGLDEVVAMIVPANHRSQAVAEKLGMTRDPGATFEHPLVPEDSRAGTRTHWLYRIDRATWSRLRPAATP